jgi:hypothetical protein
MKFEGAFITSLSVATKRQKIFRDDRDRLYYRERVEPYRQR